MYLYTRLYIERKCASRFYFNSIFLTFHHVVVEKVLVILFGKARDKKRDRMNIFVLK